MFIKTALLIDFNKVKIEIYDYFNINESTFSIKNGNISINILNITKLDANFIILELEKEIFIKSETFLLCENNKTKIFYFPLFKTDSFNNKYYTTTKLGYLYNKDETTFKVWSPIAKTISVLIYTTGDIEEPCTGEEFTMQEINGLFITTIKRNLKNYFYTYKVNVHGNINETIDPYTKAIGINGYRGAIIDFQQTDPMNWHSDKGPTLKDNTESIIYELSIRDISTNKNSNVEKNGKYLGLTEENSQSKLGLPTAYSHIRDLGITHVQILPCFDFSHTSVDEKNPIKYNWGYDPVNFNAPEGSFSCDPYDPLVRIRELKEMILHFHKNNIGVNMDVVYNHLFIIEESSFEKIFPGYYFRFDNYSVPSNGTGVGNDTASENKMMTKFIIDSLLFWAEEYHIDGFRFDLMGILDVNTMNEIHTQLKQINKNIMIYGEGWNLNTLLDADLKANIDNSYKMPYIGFFNDFFRDTVKGNNFVANDKGYSNGKVNQEHNLKNCIVAGVNYFNEQTSRFLKSSQSINYLSCHDNHTLWDKFNINSSEYSVDDKKNMMKLSFAILLTSQGVPFIHSGMEFARTKNGIENSYNSPDEINWIDWDRKSEFNDLNEYLKGLIDIRKNHPAFKLKTEEQIKNSILFLDNTPPNVVAYKIIHLEKDEPWKEIIVIFNPNTYAVDVYLGEKMRLTQVVNKYRASNQPLTCVELDSLHLESISASVFYREEL
ncbi:type I pullulanase [Clostridium sp. DL1XJH146]